MEQMRCPQCGRMLTADDMRAGLCSSCGHPVALGAGSANALAEDDSQTRPMPPSLRPASVAPDAPPAAPDAPPTAPPPPPAEALTAPATPPTGYRPPALPRATPGADMVMSAASERTAVMPPGMVPSSAITSPSAPEGESTERKRAGVGWIAALALLIVLLLGSAAALLAANGQLGGLLGQASATATTLPASGPPPPPTGFTRYTGAGYTIDYPAGWVQTTLPGSTVLFANPSIQATFQVQTFDHATDPQSLEDSFFTQLGPALLGSLQGTSAVSAKTGPTTVNIAGTLWTREEADMAVTSVGKTITWHAVALAVAHEQQTYLVTFFAPSANFAGQDNAFFEKMVNSLLLVSSQP